MFRALFAVSSLAASLIGCASAETAADKAMTTPSENTSAAARQEGAVDVTEVNFDKGSFVLSEGSRQALRDLVAKAQAGQVVDEIKILAWADKDYPADSKMKVAKGDRDLAEKRAISIRDFVKNELKIDDVDTYNMAERPGTVATLFNSEEARLKRALENAGVTSGEGKAITGKASRAVVMLMEEN